MISYNEAIGSVRHYDDNGYLYVEKSPVLKAGVLEYLGSEIMDSDGLVDGVKVDPEKIYKVFLPIEELEKAKDTFNLKPITDDHKWLGVDGDDAKKYQQGMTGEKSFIEDGMLYVPLVFTGNEIINDIENGKVELSASYTNSLKKSDNPEYDFIAMDYTGNHIALVDRGRCGSNVRVLNSKINKQEDLMPKKVKNEAILKVNGKEIDLEKFFEEEATEETEGGEAIHDDSISQNEDKRKLIDEIGGILKTAGVDEEVIRTVIEKAEALSYEPSEASEADNECKAENEDEEKVDNSEEEVVEEKKEEVENEDVVEEKEEEKEEIKSENSYSKIYNKALETIKASLKAEEEDKRKAYNSASQILGDFNAYGMTAKEMLVKALNHAGISVDGKETDAELQAMLKVCNSRSRIDNSFSYDIGIEGQEEHEFTNIK